MSIRSISLSTVDMMPNYLKQLFTGNYRNDLMSIIFCSKSRSLFYSRILSTYFISPNRIGKPHKKPETEVYGRSQPGRASEKSLSREALERHNRIEEREKEEEPTTKPQQRYDLIL